MMMSAMTRWRRHRGEAGLTLTELLVTMMIFGVLMAIVFGVLISLTYQSRDTLARTQTLQEARIGLSQIDRQVRSGNVILNPAEEDESTSGVDPYYSMRIFTQEDGVAQCVQWRVIDQDEDGFGDLEFRTWNPQNLLDFTDWGGVAHNLIRMDASPEDADDIDRDDPSTWPPFWVDTAGTDSTVAHYVRITLRLKDPQEREDAKPVAVTSVVTGRNTVFGYPASSCAEVPPV